MRLNFLRLLALMALASATMTETVRAQVTTVGLGTYSLSKPGDATGPSTNAGQPTLPLVAPGWTGPVPTNDWWSSLVFDRANDPLSPWSRPMYAHPLVFQARPEGLEMRYPTDVTTDPTFYYHGTAWDVRLAVDGLSSPDARLARAGDFTATAAWTDGTRGLEATMGHGLPFVYFSVVGAPVSVTFGSTPNVRERRDGSVFLTVNGHHYGIFGPVGSTWTGTSTLSSDLGGRGFVSIAVLPDSRAETFETYRRRAYAYVTGSRVEWQVDPATQRVTTTFAVTTEPRESGPDLVGSTFLAQYRHQWRNSSTARTAWTYVSPRGTMKVVDGNTFTTSLAFGGVLPGLPTPCGTTPDAGLYALVDAVHLEANLVFPTGYPQKAVALVWGNKGAYQTFFGGEAEYIHGINWLPITGGSLYLGRHPVYVRANYDNMVARNGAEPDRWADIAWSYLALSNAPSALNRLPVNGVTSPETGESRAHTRHWITSLVGLGRVDTTVTADHASHAVFDKDGRRTYAVYNPGAEPLEVRFTDGFATTVPANALVGVCASGTAVEERPGHVPGLAISASWPNPFDGRATLSLSVGHAQHVVVSLYDVLGRRVATLHDGVLDPGPEQIIPYDASTLPAGVYLVEAAGADGRVTRVVTKTGSR